MSNPIRISFAVALLLQTGCAVGFHAHPLPGTVIVAAPVPPPPPPPAPVQISPNDAVAVGLAFCQQNGFACWVDNTNLVQGGNVWRVMYDARGSRSRGKVHVDVDAWSGALLRANVMGPVVYRASERDDDGPGRGRGHAYGHYKGRGRG